MSFCVCLQRYILESLFLQKHKKTIPGESLIGRWLFQLLPADLPDSLICQDVTCPLSKSSRKQSLIYLWNPSICSHFQVSSVNCHAPMVLPVLSPPPPPPNLLRRLNKWPRGKYIIYLMCSENMVMGHIMMGEHQAKCRAINLYVACCFKQGKDENKIWKFLDPPFMVFAIKGGLAFQ